MFGIASGGELCVQSGASGAGDDRRAQHYDADNYDDGASGGICAGLGLWARAAVSRDACGISDSAVETPVGIGFADVRRDRRLSILRRWNGDIGWAARNSDGNIHHYRDGQCWRDFRDGSAAGGAGGAVNIDCRFISLLLYFSLALTVVAKACDYGLENGKFPP